MQVEALGKVYTLRPLSPAAYRQARFEQECFEAKAAASSPREYRAAVRALRVRMGKGEFDLQNTPPEYLKSPLGLFLALKVMLNAPEAATLAVVRGPDAAAVLVEMARILDQQ